MAHELILMANGKYSMARASDTTHSWHGLENIIPPDAPFNTWLEMSGMNFTIHESQVEYAGHKETKIWHRVKYYGEMTMNLHSLL